MVTGSHNDHLPDVTEHDAAAILVTATTQAAMGLTLSSDLDRFREENDGFRFSRGRRVTWALYRKLIYEPLERQVRRR